ncbi:unnamed protein product [Absidia cylindrospora]
MTKDDTVARLTGDLYGNDTQQQKPFHVVLIDIKKTMHSLKIHCVEKPLMDSGDLKFVALSYRWGELGEQMVDTGVGYLATVTSFNINDLFMLFYLMMMEPDLQHMDYVWVDAICVNQTNYEQRKATIYQMSNIYERANYILAVPDLHLAHLKNTMAECDDIMKGTARYRRDIYLLLHGNLKQLAAYENHWLDTINVPKDVALRTLLMRYTYHFTYGLTNHQLHKYGYDPEEALDHIFETSQAVSLSSSTPNPSKKDETSGGSGNDFFLEEMKRLHQCNTLDCPLAHFKPRTSSALLSKWIHPDHNRNKSRENDYRAWKQQIQERSATIRNSMDFLADLVKDWSSRVWVISEYSIAEKKNNLKYWFLQLEPSFLDAPHDCLGRVSFFNFLFEASMMEATLVLPVTVFSPKYHSSDPVYLRFHKTMNHQLQKQTFLEMMLKSKASKNEDRFYAVFPLFEQYKHKLGKEKKSLHGMDTIVAVKLKLFEWMTTTDKLALLFVVSHLYCSLKEKILPTFATVSLSMETATRHLALGSSSKRYPCNFDVTKSSTIMLSTISDDDDQSSQQQLYYLNVNPMHYYVAVEPNFLDYYQTQFLQNKSFCRNFQFDDGHTDTFIDVICIPIFRNAVMDNHDRDTDWVFNCIMLVGNRAKNQWVLGSLKEYKDVPTEAHWTHHYCDADGAGFNIY